MTNEQPEIFDIRAVRDEFLRAIYDQYVSVFNERQVDASFKLLTEFCENVSTNNLVLIRIPDQTNPVVPNNSSITPNTESSELQDPFQSEMISRDVAELNANLSKRPRQQFQAPTSIPPPLQQSNIESDLGGQTKRSFVDKVRDMRSIRKNPNRINPED